MKTDIFEIKSKLFEPGSDSLSAMNTLRNKCLGFYERRSIGNFVAGARNWFIYGLGFILITKL